MVTNIADVRGNLTLPTTGALGSTLTWTSSAPGPSAARASCTARPRHGRRRRDPHGHRDQGRRDLERAPHRDGPPGPEAQELAAYFFPYFKGESTADGEEIYFAASQGNDPLNWQELGDDKTVLESELGEKGLRDPFVIRSPRVTSSSSSPPISRSTAATTSATRRSAVR
ncbi:immunoglobulin-like domain-containing protein [Oerskovia sp. M15]